LFLPFSARAREWEPKAQQLRALLKLRADDVLNPFDLALKVGLTLMQFDEIPIDGGLRSYLLDGTGDHWSAGVYPIPLPDKTYLCILNPTHDPRRQRITLMGGVLAHFPSSQTNKSTRCWGWSLSSRLRFDTRAGSIWSRRSRHHAVDFLVPRSRRRDGD